MSEQSSGTGPIQDQGAPLTPEEKKLIQRLFSEPIEFPQIFRNWLRTFIETSGIQLPRSAIATGAGGGSGSLAGFPAGIILPIGGSTPPTGALMCNGIAVSRTTYAALFLQIGTIWGAGDGSTTFNLPDLRDRSLYGVGSKVALGQTDGGALGTRGPKHDHGVNIANSSSGFNTLNGNTDQQGSHSHGIKSTTDLVKNASDASATILNSAAGVGYNTEGVGNHQHGCSVSGTVNVSGNVNGSTSGGGVRDTPAYAGVNYIITT